LINGLLYLIEAGNTEIARRQEFEEKLDYICQQLELLKSVNDLSEADIKSAPVVNRATDVFSAVMRYIAANVRHKSKFLWLAGYPLFSKRLILVGSIPALSDTNLQNAVQRFRDTFLINVTTRTLIAVERIYPGLYTQSLSPYRK
jgi:hypothetical protein